MQRSTEQTIVKLIYVAALSALSLYLISPFLAPIIFGGTVALAMYPSLLKFESRGWSRKSASLFMTSIFAIFVSIPFFFFIVKGTLAVMDQLNKFSTDARFKNKGVKTIIRNIHHDIMDRIQSYGAKFGLESYFSEARLNGYLKEANEFFLGFFQRLATDLPVIFIFFLVMVVCTYTFLRNADSVRLFFKKIFGLSEFRMQQFTHILIADSRSVYLSNIATGALQALIVATAASLSGLGDFFLVFFVTLILAFIPVVGAAPVALALATLAFLQEENTKAIIMLVVSVVAGVSDNLIRPYLATKGQSNIPGIAAFVFVVGGALLIGFPGLFIGLLLGSFAWDTLPLFWEELVKKEIISEYEMKSLTPRPESSETLPKQ